MPEEKKDRIREGYEKIAFGSISDPVRLLFCDEISPRSLKNMDLFSVAEIKRPKGGGMEIKLFDRIKALQCMESFQGGNAPSESICEALEMGARALKESGEE